MCSFIVKFVLILLTLISRYVGYFLKIKKNCNNKLKSILCFYIKVVSSSLRLNKSNISTQVSQQITTTFLFCLFRSVFCGLKNEKFPISPEFNELLMVSSRNATKSLVEFSQRSVLFLSSYRSTLFLVYYKSRERDTPLFPVKNFPLIIYTVS